MEVEYTYNDYDSALMEAYEASIAEYKEKFLEKEAGQAVSPYYANANQLLESDYNYKHLKAKLAHLELVSVPIEVKIV